MSMPAVVVVIACKVAFLPYASAVDEANAVYTHHKPYEWAIKHSQMLCRRHEIQLYNPDNPEAEFTPQKCMRASWQIRMQWDMGHENTSWRVWKTACPIPVVNLQTGKVLDWQMPACPRENKQGRVAVQCERDTVI